MASDEQKKENKEILIDMGGKKVPLSSIDKPHNVVIGGANKHIPNLENFPSLEPWAQEKEREVKKGFGNTGNTGNIGIDNIGTDKGEKTEKTEKTEKGEKND